jgi:hypothetical protein
MNPTITIDCDIHIRRRAGGRQELHQGEAPAATTLVGRVPRVARLMALAVHFDRLIQEGKVADYATLARLGHVSRARITQVMNLSLLAPVIQESLLFLPLIERGREPLHLRQLQPIALEPDWCKQRAMWIELRQQAEI